MNFDLSPTIQAVQERVRAFVRTEVLPLENPSQEEEGVPADLLARLRQRAREVGVWVPQLPKEYGGLGMDAVGLCVVLEEAGYSPLGPLALHCAAPDEGNMHLLRRAATPAQRERYLVPLARGETRSCFALTERRAPVPIRP